MAMLLSHSFSSMHEELLLAAQHQRQAVKTLVLSIYAAHLSMTDQVFSNVKPCGIRCRSVGWITLKSVGSRGLSSIVWLQIICWDSNLFVCIQSVEVQPRLVSG